MIVAVVALAALLLLAQAVLVVLVPVLRAHHDGAPRRVPRPGRLVVHRSGPRGHRA